VELRTNWSEIDTDEDSTSENDITTVTTISLNVCFYSSFPRTLVKGPSCLRTQDLEHGERF